MLPPRYTFCLKADRGPATSNDLNTGSPGDNSSTPAHSDAARWLAVISRVTAEEGFAVDDCCWTRQVDDGACGNRVADASGSGPGNDFGRPV